MCDRGLDFEMNQKLFCQEELTDEQVFTACLLTARQYGGVVLPDAFRPRIESFNSGKICIRPGKEGMAHFLPSRYNADLIIRVSRYKL